MATSEADPRMAVIGMAFRLPGADTPEELWRVVRDGRDCITRFTEEELAAAGVPAEDYRAADFVGASGVLDDIAGFDAQHFAMSAREARLTDPQQRMFLECAQHALENAGYPDERDGTRVGVYASTGYHLYTLQNYLLNNVLPTQPATDWTAGMQITVGNYADFTATRVAHRLGLTGPAVNIQTGCSSSLVGVQSAAQSLLMGDCDIALVGATAVHVPQALGYRYVKGSILSRSGRLRAFDAGADGTVGGTGVLAVVLKPLARAVADGDTVHGVIRGWGINNDGADKTAFAAPSAQGQRAAIRQALRRAGVGADTIGYLETHGTGTLKGDPIEFDGATGAYREDTDRTGYCALGSTKANIGHLDAASGLAGLVKTLLVLQHGVIPPMANFRAPNPGIDLDHSPFYIPRTARPWPESDTPRRAGITSLGVGGTNVHLILEQAPEPTPRTDATSPPDVLLVSGSSQEALADNARALRDRLRQSPTPHVADLVTTAALGRAHRRHRLAARGSTPAALADALDAWLASGAGATITAGTAPQEGPARVTFQFTGQGSQYPGMADALHERFPAAREVLDACEHHYRDLTGDPLLTAPSEHTDTAQPALFALQCALVRLWREAGVEPSAVTGHSVGEYAALYAAGALSLDEGLRLTTVRGQLMRQRCAPGAMVAAALDRETALALADEVPGLEPAVTNGDRAQVLAGPVEAVERVCALLDERGTPGQLLPVTRAFHTALMQPMLEEFRKVLDDVDFRPVRIPFVSALDGVTRPPGWTPDADHFVRHTREPVRFDEALRGIGAQQPDVLLEIGPHTTLSGLARRALPDVRSLPSLRRGTGLGVLWGAAAGLHCAGADLGWRVLLAGSGGRRIPLPGYRFQHKDYWTGPEPTALSTGRSAREEAEVVQQEAAVARVLHSIVEATARHLGEDPSAIVGDASFFDLGADSLLMISVLRELEQEHRVKVTMRQLFEETGTPRRLAQFIVARMPDAPSDAPQPPAVPVPAPVPTAAVPVSPLVSPPPPAPEPAPAVPGPAPEYATREELEDLAEKIHQMSRIQLQMMSQLSQLLALQTASVSDRLNGKVAK
ncbi:beta-ketoacyl synthase N-terminal-like domain-containing protein [Streptomyces sp. T12]|uniref:type I polyketide synthase n=4 Tax=unclassified Streptomyces TaxID=2593676 RepID=UPI0023670886|nr:beta-ketoacyl synthase N-terminal-like domain-containing protein [Streptomyces sp. T12]WDF35425.1 beta-ketoacyl synthase N-terminal-like domain-containing protein [Streptomyces sp. T12]